MTVMPNSSSLSPPNITQLLPHSDIGKAEDLGAAVYNILTCSVTLVGNFLLVLTLYRDPFRCFRTPSSYLLMAMATANVITGLVAQPLFAVAHLMLYLGEGLKRFDLVQRLGTAASLFSLNISFFMLFSLAIDSYVAIAWPIKYWVLATVGKAKIWIVFSMFYSLIFGALPFVGLSISLAFKIDLHVNSTVNCLMLVASSVILFLSFRAKSKESVRLRRAVQAVNITSRVSTMKRNFQKLLFLHVLLFMCLALLGTLVIYLDVYCIDCAKAAPTLFDTVVMVLRGLVFLKPASDPFVFAWRAPRYRKALKELGVTCSTQREVQGLEM